MSKPSLGRQSSLPGRYVLLRSTWSVRGGQHKGSQNIVQLSVLGNFLLQTDHVKLNTTTYVKSTYHVCSGKLMKDRKLRFSSQNMSKESPCPSFSLSEKLLKA